MKGLFFRRRLVGSVSVARLRVIAAVGLAALLVVVLTAESYAQSTAFTYQGRLGENGNAANGIYDLQFTIYGVAAGGSAIAGPLTNAATGVTNGLFTVALDFGAGAFNGSDRWLQIAVRTNAGGVFTPVSPRQPITAAPYALYALSGPGAGGLWGASGAHIFTTNAGNVGIGTAAPAARLHIDGGDVLMGGGNNFRMANGLNPNVETVLLDSQFFGGSLLRLRDSAAVSTVELRSDPAQLSLFNSGGIRVAVNANGPTQGGSISLRNGNSLITALLQGEEQGNFGAAFTLANAAANNTISLLGDNGLGEARAGVVGDLGAGVTTPAARLHVRGRPNDTRPGLLIETLAGSPSVLTTSIELLGNALDAHFEGGPSALRLNPNSTGNVLLGLGGGNVGVNTAAPEVKLHVAGAGNTSASGGGLLVIEHGPSGNELAFDGNEVQARNNGSANALVLNKEGGGVGVGVPAPQGRLHVRSADVGVSVADTQDDELIIEDGDARLGIYSSDSGAGGSSIALVEMSGNVFQDQWGIVRETSNAGDTLWFTFGTDRGALNNNGIMALEPNGSVFVDGLLEVQGNILGFDVECSRIVIGPDAAGFELTVEGNASIGDLTVLDDLIVLDNLLVNGTKQFRIDDPRDPANRYLQHSCHEGPEPQNVYNGIATLDAAGEATIELPAYFAAINRDPRYSLTPIGAAMPNLHVSQTIDLKAPATVFRVAGGIPGKQVSWEIKGIRNDPHSRARGIAVEIEKQGPERGRYLSPELYGQPAALRIGAAAERR